MNDNAALDNFQARLAVFRPQKHIQVRSLALYSAAIAVADDEILSRAIETGQSNDVERDHFFEIVLQSYLFLGFPRMLGAVEHLGRHFPPPATNSLLHMISPKESQTWFSNGLQLCRRVYADHYASLKEKVETLSPEVFRWMVIEGYGKVLSRPGLSIIDREMAIVSCLMMEKRDKQLFSHIKGALNVGASAELVRSVIDDLGDAAGDGYRSAVSFLDRLG
jgi:alkylhydroperoxidase/carboxymuconolactone decarboxylase family protein YurZ